MQRRRTGAFVFASERGGPMTRSNVSKMMEADRYYIDMSIAPHGDFYDDGGC